MTIYLHDTLRAKKVAVEPSDPDHVTMYLCGPTVDNYAHVGNARPAVVFDLPGVHCLGTRMALSGTSNPFFRRHCHVRIRADHCKRESLDLNPQ